MSDDIGSSRVIRVKSLFFATYRDLLGIREEEVELPAGASVRDLVEMIRARPGVDDFPAAPAVAINREYARLDQSLSDGDEVAFIPPVAGG
ncbi:MAG: molybdopterin converting factor subunit 1 [Gemmatimonadales bacterium]|jgi:molybdopterin converting factor subunit 1